MDILKHAEIFDPKCLEGKSIAVIGCGATGSMTALHLAKLGLKEIYLYDDDTIESYNIPNQLLYSIHDIGFTKATTLAEKLRHLVGSPYIYGIEERLGTKRITHEIVFVCVDTMKARQEIFDNGIYLKGWCKLLVDMRMGARVALTYALDPNDLDQVDRYRETLYNDDEVKPELGSCGVTLSVGATAATCSSLAIWSFIDWMKREPQNNKMDHRWLEFATKVQMYAGQEMI